MANHLAKFFLVPRDRPKGNPLRQKKTSGCKLCSRQGKIQAVNGNENFDLICGRETGGNVNTGRGGGEDWQFN